MEKWVTSMFDSMIGAMIGEDDSLKWQTKQIFSMDLPQHMEAHIQVLDAIQFCSEMNLAPCPDTLISVMKSQNVAGEQAVANIQFFNEFESDNREQTVKTISAIISNWLEEYRTGEAVQEINDIWNGSGTHEDKVQDIYDIASSIRLDENLIKTFSQPELYDKFIGDLRELCRNRQEKGEVGARLPWEASDAFFSRFKPREISALMAYTGWGKTMFGMDIAEHIAWFQKYPCDVVVLLLETDPINIQRRQFAKRALIPYPLLDSGKINPDDKYKSQFDKFYKKFVLRNKTGRIHYVWIPEPTIDAVISAMTTHARIIENTGRDIFFILDYLQKIQPKFMHEFAKKHEFYESNTERIAARTRALNAHTMILVQENPDTGEAFGSKTIRQKSQMLFSLKRFKLEGTENVDKPVTRKRHGQSVPLTDSLGNERFYHRKDQELSSRAELRCVKANDSAGFTLNLDIETPMGIIKQNQSQLKKLRANGMLLTRRSKSS